VKFTGAGTVAVTIHPIPGAQIVQPVRERLLQSGILGAPDDLLLAFAISDTGIGIPESKLSEIFGAFKKADSEISRRYGGTGIGLSISREIARLLGGEIHAESELGVGSTFTLYLPLRSVGLVVADLGAGESGVFALDAAVTEQSATTSDLADQWAQEVLGLAQSRRRGAAERRRPVVGVPTLALAQEAALDALLSKVEPLSRRFAGQKVLIVDDDVRNSFALTSVLEQDGLTVLYAENGREGIEVLEQHENVALVLMATLMPEMDGYAAIEAIRRMPQFAGLPIIALTAKAMKGDREKSIEAGASDYLTKPVDIDHVLTLVRQWLPAD
jgi:CheY-like chemotaxis protein